ncbi:MAG: aminopeptidase P family protein [Bacteroidota bacterium]|nr:aminopeptidase P family protein [Bacteroidota bacterium]
MFAKEIYIKRRERLCERVDSGIILLPGNVDVSMNYPENTYTFRQNSHFLYFAGLDLQGLFVTIDSETRETILFADELTMDDIIWTGPKESFKEIAATCGIETVMPVKALETFIQKAKAKERTIHFLPPYRAETAIRLSQLLGIPVQEIKYKASERLIRAIVALRSVKGPEELIELEKAAEIGYKMHEAVMANALPGVTERELAAKAEYVALSKGTGISFPTILTQRGEILHGHDHGLTLEKGNFLVCDAGAESLSHYASDFTRTIPVGGRFTQRQKELYQIVLDANNKAFDLIKPGIFYRDVHLASCLVLAEGLKSLGIMKGDMKEAVAQGAHALFMVHGLGHMMGLDVHDMEDIGENYVGYDEEISRSPQFGLSSLRMGRRLQPGFVMTVEPGLYFIPALIKKWQSEKKLTDFLNYEKALDYVGTGGIRLEDDVVVTESGNRMPGKKRLPITPEEIEGLY